MEPRPMAVKSPSPNHWTAREVPHCIKLYIHRQDCKRVEYVGWGDSHWRCKVFNAINEPKVKNSRDPGNIQNMESSAVFLSCPGAPLPPDCSLPGKASLISKILLGSLFWLTQLLCASLPSVLNYLALWRFCFVMAFTCSHSPHPARTVGSTLSISLWPWPHPDSLEIVLSQFYIFYIILGFPRSSLAHFLDQEPQPPLLSTPVSAQSSKGPGGNKQQEAGSQKQGYTPGLCETHFAFTSVGDYCVWSWKCFTRWH